MKGGGFERLAFRGGSVIETKNMKTGATHTPAEFAAYCANIRLAERLMGSTDAASETQPCEQWALKYRVQP